MQINRESILGNRVIFIAKQGNVGDISGLMLFDLRSTALCRFDTGRRHSCYRDLANDSRWLARAAAETADAALPQLFRT